MEKKIIKDLYCYQCSLQFDKKTIYEDGEDEVEDEDDHLDLVW